MKLSASSTLRGSAASVRTVSSDTGFRGPASGGRKNLGSWPSAARRWQYRKAHSLAWPWPQSALLQASSQ